MADVTDYFSDFENIPKNYAGALVIVTKRYWIDAIPCMLPYYNYTKMFASNILHPIFVCSINNAIAVPNTTNSDIIHQCQNK